AGHAACAALAGGRREFSDVLIKHDAFGKALCKGFSGLSVSLAPHP
ncbi:hypothetical protein HMPREF9440_00907, partial [Sutterella parvirubra YIT 11816]